jgi:isopentenyl-diphosphate Delta-isomerase
VDAISDSKQLIQQTTSRKKEHVDLCVNDDVTFKNKTAGWEKYEFNYNALPELNFVDIDTRTSFLGKELSMPLMISSMTGGYDSAERINAQLADICKQHKIALGVGSMRQALQTDTFHQSFRVVRDSSDSIPILANIGAPEIANKPSMKDLMFLCELVGASGLIIHLNPLQELLQPEGNTNFSGVLNGIEYVVKELGLPVIVKEVGAGINADVARRLLSVGVRYIDVAGAGGTSWAGVELLRNTNRSAFDIFWDWGTPTADCVIECATIKSEIDYTLIASGGIVNGVESATAIALGADMTATARVFLQELFSGGEQALFKKISDWELQLRSTMFLTGKRTIAELKQGGNILRKVTSY